MKVESFIVKREERFFSTSEVLMSKFDPEIIPVIWNAKKSNEFFGLLLDKTVLRDFTVGPEILFDNNEENFVLCREITFDSGLKGRAKIDEEYDSKHLWVYYGRFLGLENYISFNFYKCKDTPPKIIFGLCTFDMNPKFEYLFNHFFKRFERKLCSMT